MTSVDTGLLAEHTVTKISAHKICSIYTKKNWGRLDEIPGGAQGGWRLRHSRKVKENQTLVPWIEIRGHMDGGGNRFIITFFSSISARVVHRTSVTWQPSTVL